MIPEVGSVWKARDGRLMRVMRIIEPGVWEKCPRAALWVLNPGHRMKGFTEISTSKFGHQPPAFLIPVPAADGEAG